MTNGITFSEVMAGSFSLGEDDPETGREKGEAEDTRLTMNAAVSIPDLGVFIADPDHPGSLDGSIDFSPLGTGLKVRTGVFNLFSPTEDSNLKLMVYEMGIEADGRAYYIAGHKKVKNDRGFDLWSATTTLYTTLHAGEDKHAPIIGAGVLTLGARDLNDLLSTVRVTGSDSGVDKAATLAKFGNFFMGELWDTYGPEALKIVLPER